MTDDLTPQQQMILIEQQRRLDAKMQTGDLLDSKAMTILQSGGILIALTGAVSISNYASQHTSTITLVGILCAFVAFLGMVTCALRAWHPSSNPVAGGTTWDELYDDYLVKDTSTCFMQVLSNLLTTSEMHTKRNNAKARYVSLGIWLLGLQVAAILLAAMLAAY